MKNHCNSRSASLAQCRLHSRKSRLRHDRRSVPRGRPRMGSSVLKSLTRSVAFCSYLKDFLRRHLVIVQPTEGGLVRGADLRVQRDLMILNPSKITSPHDSKTGQLGGSRVRKGDGPSWICLAGDRRASRIINHRWTERMQGGTRRIPEAGLVGNNFWVRVRIKSFCRGAEGEVTEIGPRYESTSALQRPRKGGPP
jgi:hypothetical protein